MKGWSLVVVGKDWYKEGFEETVKTAHGCGCHFKETKTPYFTLDRAYEAQKEREDGG